MKIFNIVNDITQNVLLVFLISVPNVLKTNLLKPDFHIVTSIWFVVFNLCCLDFYVVESNLCVKLIVFFIETQNWKARYRKIQFYLILKIANLHWSCAQRSQGWGENFHILISELFLQAFGLRSTILLDQRECTLGITYLK